MKSFIAKYQVAIYFVMATLIIPFTFFTLSSPLGATKGTTSRLVLVTIIKYAPTLAAFLLVALVFGKTSVKELLSRFFIWKIDVKWYLLVFLIPLVIDNLFPFLLLHTLNRSVTVQLNVSFATFSSVVLLFARFFFMGGGMGEEFGWRGYLTPYLQSKHSVLKSAVIIGLLWTAWHFPNYWMGNKSGTEIAYLHVEKIFRAVPMAIVYAWIFNNTRGSVLLVSLMHASVNTFGNLYDIQAQEQEVVFFTTQRIFDLFAIGFWMITSLILVFRRGALMNKLS